MSYSIAVADQSFIFNDDTYASKKQLDLSFDHDTLYNSSTRPDFTGVWVLDHSASDDPKAVLKKLKSGRKDFTGRGSKGGYGRRSGNRNRGGKTTSKRSNRTGNDSNNLGPDEIDKLLSNEIKISHKEPLLSINLQQYGEQQIYTDFRGSSISSTGNINQRVIVAGWEGNSLIIEETSSSGRNSIHTLTLLSNPLRLERIIELINQNQNTKPVQIRQIYLTKN